MEEVPQEFKFMLMKSTCFLLTATQVLVPRIKQVSERATKKSVINSRDLSNKFVDRDAKKEKKRTTL